MKIPATFNEATSKDAFLRTLSNLFRSNIREYGMLIALIAVMAFFQIQTGGVLMRPVNITNLVLQNSYVIVTSDHGEMFERGELGHATALMYAPVTHIPLLISAPGQANRSDFHSATSNVDLLPTIVKIAGKEIPEWVEGRLLPGFGGNEDSNRSIFPMMGKDNAAFQPLKHATFVLIKNGYELLFYTGYPGHEDQFELYHLEQDPHELQNLFSKDITTTSHMKNELLEAISTANRNFQMR